MAQVHVSLPEDLSSWAESRVAQGGYADPADYVRDVVRRDREHEEKLARLRDAIDEGLASPETDTTVEDVIADGLRRGRDGVVRALRDLWAQGVESGVAVDGNFHADDVARRGGAVLETARPRG